MLHNLLIANRGEIAVRIIRTAKAMGLRTVAVYSEADAGCPHVTLADAAVCLGPAAVDQSYLRQDAILEAAKATGADAIHPGYGLLSENAAFVEACDAAGVTFVGPTAGNVRCFGLKHTARALAARAGVPLLPGTGLLISAADAQAQAARIGFPVILKASGGGGGIGMRRCSGPDELDEAYRSVERLAQSHFKGSGLFLEKFIARARHVEVQAFGDGAGRVVTLGQRDCSAQRRNQKVIEESPPPHLPDDTLAALDAAARTLLSAAAYRSAGTVEFVVDADSGRFYFLEVNTRLQVEHPVTEAVFGVDLVRWMLQLAAGAASMFDAPPPTPRGHAIEARVYAEDPAKDFRPSSGLITHVAFPEGVRADTFIAAGHEVTPHYDPLLAKLIVHGDTRDEACARLTAALRATRIDGIATNLAYLRDVVDADTFRTGRMTTAALATVTHQPAAVDVLAVGSFSIIVDHPGRLGYWGVGVPPSGPMDDLSFRLGNRVLGNAEGAPGIECTGTGPTLRFGRATTFCLAGAAMKATLDGVAVPYWTAVSAPAGATLKLGGIEGPGVRAYVLVRGGFDIPPYLGSSTTFTLGGFGGHGGRTLRAGDVLSLHEDAPPPEGPLQHALPEDARPTLTHAWDVQVLLGPHTSPDFFTDEDMAALQSAAWRVHHNSARTGVRLIGPRPRWARRDGGDAGLHPSNIHDNAYAVGTIDFTGDMPVILGPDGPSLGGFVCPATIIEPERWKIGQMRPGDTVKFTAMSPQQSRAARAHRDALIRDLRLPPPPPAEGRGEGASPAVSTTCATSTAPTLSSTSNVGPLSRREDAAPSPRGGGDGGGAVLHTLAAKGHRPRVVYRQAGDDYVLIEYGPLVLDLALRFRVQLLYQALQREQRGIIDLTPGIRSLQVHFDPRVLERDALLDHLIALEDELGDIDDARAPSRIVHLPLSWDDPAIHETIARYMRSVRDDAPWCPSNIEFIRRVNGLKSIDDVKRTVFDASYLVLGLGDVYLGAPVATPVDPRQRFVTTKYNPARTWTPPNVVGIGGAYLCIYGMEGPGGYQLFGRTLQVWDTFRATADFARGTPWLLRFFDQVRFFPVTHAELTRLRRDFPLGRYPLRVEQTTFSLREHLRFLERNAGSIAAFRATQRAAFDAERARWAAAGEFDRAGDELAPAPDADAAGNGKVHVPEGAEVVESPLGASVWQVLVKDGQVVSEGQTLAVLEAMKMESPVPSPRAGRVVHIACRPGQLVSSGTPLFVIQ